MFLLSQVGNKDDSPKKKVVSTKCAQKFVAKIGIELFETSAKNNVNVEEVKRQRETETETERES